jgi:hypothetical protein
MAGIGQKGFIGVTAYLKEVATYLTLQNKETITMEELFKILEYLQTNQKKLLKLNKKYRK